MAIASLLLDHPVFYFKNNSAIVAYDGPFWNYSIHSSYQYSDSGAVVKMSLSLFVHVSDIRLKKRRFKYNTLQPTNVYIFISSKKMEQKISLNKLTFCSCSISRVSLSLSLFFLLFILFCVWRSWIQQQNLHTDMEKHWIKRSMSIVNE